MKLGSSRGMDTKRPRGSERSKPRHELQLTRPSQPPYPWPPEQAQPGVSKPCRTTVDVVLLRLRPVERSEFVVIVARYLLDARLGRQVIGIVGRQLDAEMGEVLTLVADLLPGGRRHQVARVGSDVMRVDQGHEQAEWIGRSFAALQELDDAFTAHPGYLAGRSIDISGYISTVVVRVAAAGRVIPVEDTERSSLRLLNG